MASLTVPGRTAVGTARWFVSLGSYQYGESSKQAVLGGLYRQRWGRGIARAKVDRETCPVTMNGRSVVVVVSLGLRAQTSVTFGLL